MLKSQNMKLNPIFITEETVFLVGPSTLEAGFDAQEFALAEEKCRAMNFEVVNPTRILEHTDRVVASASDVLNVQSSYLAMCSKIVTLKGFEESRNAMRLLAIGRQLEKEVIHYSNFFKNVTSTTNHSNAI
jgi:hypothetical protein